MQKLRRFHTYLGVLFAPLLLFFVCSGWYQTMNPDRRKAPGEAEGIVDKARSVHADALLPSPTVETYATTPFRYFVAVMSAAFVITTVMGLVLAFRFSKRKWAVLVCFIAGFVLPLALLLLAHNR
jgi:uncharacterized iron-regulated membrane protein